MSYHHKSQRYAVLLVSQQHQIYFQRDPAQIFRSISVDKSAYHMDTLNAIASSSDGRDSEDALRVLGRVADAFDNPSLHKVDKERLFVVNVVKSDHLLTVRPCLFDSSWFLNAHTR